LRTAIPHVLHAYGTLSIRDFEQRAIKPRRFVVESASRQTMFAAIASLTTDNPGAVFTQAQVRDAMAALGHRWTKGDRQRTLRE
jgi:hypothetical protein